MKEHKRHSCIKKSIDEKKYNVHREKNGPEAFIIRSEEPYFYLKPEFIKQ